MHPPSRMLPSWIVSKICRNPIVDGVANNEIYEHDDEHCRRINDSDRRGTAETFTEPGAACTDRICVGARAGQQIDDEDDLEVNYACLRGDYDDPERRIRTECAHLRNPIAFAYAADSFSSATEWRRSIAGDPAARARDEK